MEKGISPIVAVVLLIGITMAVSALLAIWSLSFIQGRLPEGKPQECEIMDFQIDKCTVSGNKIYITLFNYAKVDAKNLTAQLINSTYSGNTQNLGDISPGEIKTFNIDKDVENFDKVVVSSKICPNLRRETICR